MTEPNTSPKKQEDILRLYDTLEQEGINHNSKKGSNCYDALEEFINSGNLTVYQLTCLDGLLAHVCWALRKQIEEENRS